MPDLLDRIMQAGETVRVRGTDAYWLDLRSNVGPRSRGRDVRRGAEPLPGVTSGPVLVTGLTGLLGSQVVPRLRKEDVEFQGVSRSEGPSPHSHGADLSDAGAALDVVASISPTAILHLAGTQQGAPSELHADNVLATANVMQAAAQMDSRPAILVVGSAAEYGAPSNVVVNGAISGAAYRRLWADEGRRFAACARELADRSVSVSA